MMNKEAVNHPDHYNQGGIEVFDIMRAYLGEDALENFCLCNALKYILRSRHKGKQLEDLKKARFYLNEIINNNTEDNGTTNKDMDI